MGFRGVCEVFDRVDDNGTKTVRFSGPEAAEATFLETPNLLNKGILLKGSLR